MVETTPMYLKIPTELKDVLKQLSAKERTTLAGLTISCIKSGLVHRINEGSVEERKINELLAAARVHHG